MSLSPDTREPRVFAVGCGNNGRNFQDFFLEHDIALIGPGRGDWRDSNNHVGVGNKPALDRFVQIAAGDIVMMRHGHKIVAVGEAVGREDQDGSPYKYLDRVERLESWDLYHSIRVRWTVCDEPATYKVQTRCCEVWATGLTDWARGIVASATDRPLRDEPPETEPIEARDLVLPDGDTRKRIVDVIECAKVLQEAVEQRDWSDAPSEHETVALLVVPLLQALGWKPEWLALEHRFRPARGRIDVAAFASVDRSSDGCRLIVEAKRLGAGLGNAWGQVRRYADGASEYPGPLIVTDGFQWELCVTTDPGERPVTAHLPGLERRHQEFFDQLLECCRPPE